MYTDNFEDRDLVIWDEAHLVNDLFSEHNAIYFSEKRMQSMLTEITDAVTITDVSIAKKMRQLVKDCGTKGKICDSNYQAYLRALEEIYIWVAEASGKAAQNALRSNKSQQYTKLSRFSKKYEGLACKIGDFFQYSYEHVFEYKEEDSSFSVKPIFVGTMFDALQTAPRNLFMSATVSGDFMTKTLNLNPQKTKFIKLPPVFPKENKEIVFFNPLALNYTSLQQQATIDELTSNVVKIVDKHVSAGERGIVLAPSFKLQQAIVKSLHAVNTKNRFKIFEQKQGEKLETVLKQFKDYTGGPAVLISPAMFEGVDLPGDLSRFQILVKAPFPSLADKRMKFILDSHPDLYNAIAIMKIIQGAGRSVRSEDDHATTYILDKNAQRLFSGPYNVWKDEFITKFTSFLE
jgi:Rad3-related DNA helicase